MTKDFVVYCIWAFIAITEFYDGWDIQAQIFVLTAIVLYYLSKIDNRYEN